MQVNIEYIGEQEGRMLKIEQNCQKSVSLGTRQMINENLINRYMWLLDSQGPETKLA